MQKNDSSYIKQQIVNKELKNQSKNNNPALNLSDRGFKTLLDLTASANPTPGGGSILACVGALGISLGMMNANISSNKKGREEKREEFQNLVDAGKILQEKLIRLIDEDTVAYQGVIAAHRFPKKTENEKKVRKKTIQKAMRYAIETQCEVMKIAFESMNLVEKITEIGNPSCASDSAVGGIMLAAAVKGAGLNVRTNIAILENEDYKAKINEIVEKFEQKATFLEGKIVEIAKKKL